MFGFLLSLGQVTAGLPGGSVFDGFPFRAGIQRFSALVLKRGHLVVLLVQDTKLILRSHISVVTWLSSLYHQVGFPRFVEPLLIGLSFMAGQLDSVSRLFQRDPGRVECSFLLESVLSFLCLFLVQARFFNRLLQSLRLGLFERDLLSAIRPLADAFVHSGQLHLLFFQQLLESPLRVA